MTRDFDADDWRLLLRATQALEQDHRYSRNEAEERAADPAYDYRAQAVEAANFHAAEINKLSLLASRVWRRISDSAA